ncbi:MAG: RluA family pseudouridine synthase [Hespellia sp.]|nr:RluA family pseudouridine synthase [Hespellia sp.]
MVKKISCVIEAKEDGRQIHDIMRHQMELTEKQIRQAKYRENGICLNGEQKYTVATVKTGDWLEVRIAENSESKIPSFYDETIWSPADGILYEDEDLVAVNKPAGVVSHPSPGHYNDSMASLLTGYYEKKNEMLNLRCIGRLDKDTSGVLLFAKNQVAADRLAKQRLSGELSKEYQALAQGHFEESEGTIQMGITKIPGEIQARIDAEGKAAVTHYRVIGEHMIRPADAKPDTEPTVVSLVHLHLDTGRTHQIRLHLSWKGHPLLGDDWYGGHPAYCKRAALHAADITFIQPFSKERICLEAALPQDMAQIWNMRMLEEV